MQVVGLFLAVLALVLVNRCYPAGGGLTASDARRQRGIRRDPASPPRLSTRVAMISLHTSPLATPGVGDAGGLNVYVAEVARRLGERGLKVDVFTRRRGPRTCPESSRSTSTPG